MRTGLKCLLVYFRLVAHKLWLEGGSRLQLSLPYTIAFSGCQEMAITSFFSTKNMLVGERAFVASLTVV